MLRKTLPKTFTLLVALLFRTCFAAGPGQGIGLSLVGYSLSDSPGHDVHPGYTLTIEAQLINYDTNIYVGPVSFGLKHANGMVLTNADDIFDQPAYSGYPIYMGPQDTIPALFHVHIDPMYFIPGPDVVVVWPITQLPVVDSISIQLLITADSVSAGIGTVNNAVFRYSIQENEILLLNLSAETNFKQVRIYDLLGKQVSTLNSDHITTIPVPSLPKGIYLCEMVTVDGQTHIIRFIH